MPVTRLDILQSVPFFRERPKRFRQESEVAHLQCWFTRLRDKTYSLDSDEIAKIKQAKQIHGFSTNFFDVDVNLNPPGGVAQIEKVAFAHVAVRSDATSDTKRFPFFKFAANLCDRSAGFEGSAEWLGAARAKCVKFFMPQCDQLVFFFHVSASECKALPELQHVKS